MRKVILVFSLLFLGNALQAQLFKIGPKAGANLVKIEGMSFEDAFKLGYYVGGFVEIKLSKQFYLQPEVLFAETNLNTTSDFRQIYEDLMIIDTLKSIKLQALHIPLTLNWRIANVFALSGGAMFSRNIKRGDGILDNAQQALATGDISLVGGVNFMFSKFRVNARYIRGIKDQNNIDNQDPWKKQTIQLGVGFVF